MKYHIETERLILRELLPTDDEAMFELDSNPEVRIESEMIRAVKIKWSNK
jgi:RimJ/RimL family protein N-acetyltransferase